VTAALRSLVKAVAIKIAEDAAVGAVGKVVLLDVATAALASVRTSLPMLLGPNGTWDALAEKLAVGLIDGIRPALVGKDPALLKRLANREQITQLVGVVLREVATTPALVTGKHASGEAQAVLAAVAAAMTADGADLLHAEGGDPAIGARLISRDPCFPFCIHLAHQPHAPLFVACHHRASPHSAGSHVLTESTGRPSCMIAWPRQPPPSAFVGNLNPEPTTSRLRSVVATRSMSPSSATSSAVPVRCQ
jgi:hypothetical protein